MSCHDYEVKCYQNVLGTIDFHSMKPEYLFDRSTTTFQLFCYWFVEFYVFFSTVLFHDWEVNVLSCHAHIEQVVSLQQIRH